MVKVTMNTKGVDQLSAGIADKLKQIVEDVARTHRDKDAAAIEAELKRRMASAGVSGGDWRDAALAISEGRPVKLHLR